MPANPDSETIDVTIHGAAGRMGRRLIELIDREPGMNVVGAMEAGDHPNLEDDALKNSQVRADVEIIETHHRFKADAPSGTALKFGQLIADVMGQTEHRHGRHGITGERPEIEMEYHAVRAGDDSGQHALLFGMRGEKIEWKVAASAIAIATPAARLGRTIPGRQTTGTVHHVRRVEPVNKRRYVWALTPEHPGPLALRDHQPLPIPVSRRR